MRRVLIVDDEADARELLARGLGRLGWQVGTAADGVEAIACLDQGWSALVTDLRMPRADGLAVLAAARERLPEAIRVVITAFGDKLRVLAALNAGAHHLLEKPFGVADLDAVLRRLDQEREDRLAGLFERRLADLDLSERERELVTLVLKGLPNREIASVLDLGEQTVKNYLAVIYTKLGVASRSELFHRILPL